MMGMASRPSALVLAVILALAAGCRQEARPPQELSSAPVTANAPTEEPTRSLATGSITADPNLIRVCDGSGLGITVLSWTSTGAKYLQVHVGSPNGPIFAASGPAGGPNKTGKWVANGTTFYLQNTTNDLPLTSTNTLSTVTLKVTDKGCS